MRSIKNIIVGASQKYHWIGVFKAFSIYKNPMREIASYALRGKTNEVKIDLKNGLSIEILETGDIVTIHEIFCRNDYPVTGDEKNILDLGANIGISALFFAHNCPHADILSFEPDPRNFELFEKNTINFQKRIKFNKLAVVPTNRHLVEFTQLNSSRYGGVGVEGGNKITVPAENINTILKDTITAFGSIDILKIDIESLETEILNTIKKEYLAHIDRIYVELPYGTSMVLSGFHSHIQGQVHQFTQAPIPKLG